MWKRSKHVPTDSYFYLSRHLDKCIMIFNMRVGPIRTHMTNTQKMNNYEMSTQKITNFQVCSLDESESKGINTDKRLSHVCSMDESESKIFMINVCYSDESESKSVHVNINKSEVKDSMNVTKDE